MSTPAIIRNMADSFVRQTTPTKNYGTVSRMYVGTGHFSYLYWGNPVPRNAKVVSAKLHFYSAGTWSGSVTCTVQRVNAKWSANKITWNNDPGVTGATADQTKAGGAVLGTHWEIDITSIMQTVSNGGAWYGLRLTANGATQKPLFSMQAAASRRPWVEIEWSDNPFPPTNLLPRDGRIVGTNKPTFSFDFVDYSGNRQMSSFQIQIASDQAMSSILHDSGTVNSNIPEYSTNIRSNQIANGTFETDASNWAAGSNAVISRSTTFARTGSASLRLSSVAAGDMGALTTTTPMVAIPGQTYKADGYVRSGASARSCRLEIVWKDSGGATISTLAGSNVTSSTANFNTALTVSGEAPPTAATYVVQIIVLATAAASELHYFDDITSSVTPLFTTVFTAGTTYWWRVRTTDGAGLVSNWSIAEDFVYRAKGVLTITNPTAGSPAYVEEPTPPIIWSFTGTTQRMFQVILYSEDDDSTILWDTGRVTSTINTVTVPKYLIKYSGTLYRISVRVWDQYDRVTIPDTTAAVVTEVYFQYQFSAVPTPVTSITAAPDTNSVAVDIEVVRATSPDSFVLLRDGEVIDSDIQPVDVQVVGNPTHYILKDYPPGRQNITYSVACVVNGKTSTSNPSQAFFIQRKFSWLTDVDNNYQVAFANPEHDLEDGELSAVLQALTGDPILVTQSLYGESGTFSGRLADNLVSGLSARTMKNRLRYIRKRFNGRARLYFSDEAMEVYIHNLKVNRLSKSGGTTQYQVDFDFFQVTR